MKRIDKSRLIYLLPVAALAAAWLTRPFPDLLADAAVQTSYLTGAQKTNINLALAKLNQKIIKPGESFSFNHCVGPRSVERGYMEAPTYLNGGTAGTEGGGICLVSSLLYKSALEAGLTIKERRAHSRPVRSIKPGLDATVDYGRYDLKFENSLAKPVLIQTSCKDQIARVEIHGVNNDKTCTLVTSPIARTEKTLTIAVYKKLDGQLLPVSKDSYRR
ncbi:vanomycin resistance protein VanB [bacterium]|nr:vanomycin resistance protein VanB [bacterium]